MTDKQKENLENMKSLGFNTYRMTYDECVEEMIHQFISLADACEWDEQTRFKRELKRIQQPTS